MNWKIFSSLTLCVFQLCHTTWAQDTIDPQVRFVVSGIEDSRQKIKCEQGKVVYQQLIPKEVIPTLFANLETKEGGTSLDVSKDVKRIQSGWWALKDANLSMFVKVDRSDPGEVLKSQRLISDEKSAKILDEYEDRSRPNRGLYYVGTIASTQEVLPNGLWSMWEKLDPRFYAYSYFGSSLEKLLLKSEPPAVSLGEETVFGSPCIKVSLSRGLNTRDVFWFDTEHGFIIRRWESQLVLKGGRSFVTAEFQTSQLTESNGVWLPSDVQTKLYTPAQLDASGNFKGRPITEQFTLSDWKSDCDISPQLFRDDWPLGTDLRDTINSLEGVVLALSSQDVADLSEGQQKRLRDSKSTGTVEGNPQQGHTDNAKEDNK